jgi:hypothetical protein
MAVERSSPKSPVWFGSACESELGKRAVVKFTNMNSSTFTRIFENELT